MTSAKNGQQHTLLSAQADRTSTPMEICSQSKLNEILGFMDETFKKCLMLINEMGFKVGSHRKSS